MYILLQLYPKYLVYDSHKSDIDWTEKALHSIQEDLSRLIHPKPGKIDIAKYFLLNPGFRAVAIYRLQQRSFHSGRYRLAIMLSNINQILNGIEISVGCEIGKGLIIRHPAAIVLGEGVIIGNFAILQHGVTVGLVSSKGSDTSEYPRIGDHVTIGTHAVVLGNIFIEDYVTVGALTLVNKDVPINSTIVGIPGKVIR